jgi:hypothetical protein
MMSCGSSLQPCKLSPCSCFHATGTQQQQQQQQGDGGISLFSASAAAQQQQQQVLAEPPLPQVHSNDPHEEANVIRKALRIKVRNLNCTEQ